MVSHASGLLWIPSFERESDLRAGDTFIAATTERPSGRVVADERFLSGDHARNPPRAPARSVPVAKIDHADPDAEVYTHDAHAYNATLTRTRLRHRVGEHVRDQHLDRRVGEVQRRQRAPRPLHDRGAAQC